MKITRTSMLSGVTRTRDLPVTEAQMREWMHPKRRLVQHVFPQLSDDEREFIVSGATTSEWDAQFGLTSPKGNDSMKTKGFTLIELMIVIAIIGILAIIAIPAYQDFVIRGKVSELILAADACKTSVVEYYQSQGQWPATQAASGCANQQTRFVAAVAVRDTGEIVVTAKTGAGAIDPVAAGDVALSPTVGATGHVDWACNGADTTIPKKYLPANCR